MKKLIVMLTLASLIVTTACPAKTDISKAKSGSAKIATYANAGVEFTRSLYQSKLLTLAQKDAVADKFIQLAAAGIAFDLAVSKAESEFGSTVPKDTIEKLLAVFDTQVIEAFLSVLTSLKVTSALGKYKDVIELLKTAILAVAAIFKIRNQTATKILAAT